MVQGFGACSWKPLILFCKILWKESMNDFHSQAKDNIFKDFHMRKANSSTE